MAKRSTKLDPDRSIVRVGNEVRVVGGKSYCPTHGTAQMGDKPCKQCNPTEPVMYRNIVMASTTEAHKNREGSAFDGRNGRPFIGAVISEHFVGTSSEFATRLMLLKQKHQPDEEVLVR